MLAGLTLPEFAFIEGYGDDDMLHGRNVILHVRSSSVVEIIPTENIMYAEKETISYRFDYVNRWAVVESFTALLHYCATLDTAIDRELITNSILAKAAKWFSDYMDWEDKNIAADGI